MEIKSNIHMKGAFSIEIRNAKTGVLLKTLEMENLLTSFSQNIRCNMLSGKYTGGNDGATIRYFAFGTGNGTPAVTDTKLFREVFRKPVSQITCNEKGVVRSVCSLGALEGNYRITEIGVFCGSTATSKADSGSLLSHIMVDIKKDTNVILNIVRTDTCTINE